jgi:hypothetical protein
MRTTTLTRGYRVALILAGLLVLPQFAFAQLSAIETRALKIQGATSGAVTIDAQATVTAYTYRFPAAQAAAAGGFLYVTNTTTGELAFTNTSAITSGATPTWNGTSIVWTDPAGADNPNWSRTGNAIAATGTLGATSDQGFNIITNNKTRVGFANDGAITVNTTTDGGATTTIGRAAGHTTAINGATNITGATTVVGAMDINATGTGATNIGTSTDGGTVTIGRTGGTLTTVGSLGHTGTSSFTGNVTLGGTASALVANANPGSAGDVLVSDGANKTPIWKSLNDATGIKASAVAAASGTSVVVTGITTMEANDKVLITVEGASGVVAQVTAITVGAGFTVSFSGSFTGNVHYLVMN